MDMKNEFAGAKIDLFKMKKINASRPRLVFYAKKIFILLTDQTTKLSSPQ